ncbi:YfbM family protein [Capnocytophaga genosp. AHN8471]|uniref:YfbM family protein n=1 Tax=Capnocytophaga genosp. AHN8471 TaxID=327574 RepID=UPI00193371F3|nr:YfbM family protein [Capnocytophaga genosp. AHN8471]MBM0656439.1 YfbM family protein [Capnocytophaga genosp. AHN8471]
MGMIMYLLRISKQELESYIDKPALFLENRVDDAYSMDIDKAWGGILYLLTGKAFASGSPEDEVDSLNRIFFSAQFFDEDMDVGYGPAHYLTPEQVAGIHRKIASLTEADLKARYDTEAMNEEEELYPSLDWNEEDFEYLYFHFQALQSFFATAASRGEAIVTFLI